MSADVGHATREPARADAGTHVPPWMMTGGQAKLKLARNALPRRRASSTQDCGREASTTPSFFDSLPIALHSFTREANCT